MSGKAEKQLTVLMCIMLYDFIFPHIKSDSYTNAKRLGLLLQRVYIHTIKVDHVGKGRLTTVGFCLRCYIKRSNATIKQARLCVRSDAGLSRLIIRILVDPASCHMLVSKIKPCMSKYTLWHSETANGSLNQLWFIRSCVLCG